MSDAAAVHIAVVDDDDRIRRLLRRCFEPEGYRVSEAANRDELEALMLRDPVDLITLDLGLGGDDGLSIARSIRAASNVPIIMVTGKDDPIDMIVGLEMGADDYITKPFHVREVLARARSVLRRAAVLSESPGTRPKSDTGDSYVFDGWDLNVTRRELHDPAGNQVPLTTGEFDLLVVLVKNPNRVLSRDQIMDHLRGRDWNPDDRSIDNQIARLRKRIETDPQNPHFIKTVRGIGYSFTAIVASGQSLNRRQASP